MSAIYQVDIDLLLGTSVGPESTQQNSHCAPRPAVTCLGPADFMVRSVLVTVKTAELKQTKIFPCRGIDRHRHNNAGCVCK